MKGSVIQNYLGKNGKTRVFNQLINGAAVVCACACAWV